MHFLDLGPTLPYCALHKATLQQLHFSGAVAEWTVRGTPGAP